MLGEKKARETRVNRQTQVTGRLKVKPVFCSVYIRLSAFRLSKETHIQWV